MKHFLILCVVALALGGCAGLDFSKSILAGGASPTASVVNPVTPAMVYQAENALIAATSGLVAYRRQCVRGSIAQSCRAVIAKIQPYTAAAKTAIVNLRTFIRSNDQVNAIQAFKQLRGLVQDILAQRSAAGV